MDRYEAVVDREHGPRGAGQAREFRFLDLVAVPLRYWKRVLLMTLASMLTAVAAFLLLPRPYVAGTVLVPFSGAQSRTQLALGQLPGGVANLIGAGSGGSASERLIGVVLKSRSLADSMAMIAGRGAKEQGEVRRILAEDTRTQRNPDGSILVEVRAKDPRLAARIASTYPVLLNRMLTRLSSDGALRKQRFLQAQLDTARENLTRSEQRLLAFQQRRGAPDVQEQGRATLQAAATLQEGINQQELAVAQLRRTVTPDHPQLRAAVAELEARRGQLRRLTSGRAGNAAFVPFGEGPELRVATTRLLREFTKDEQIYQSLTAALAEAQIDANNNLPVLSVLDAATVPDHPAGSLVNTLVLATLLGLVLGLASAFVSEAVRRVRRGPENEPFFVAWDQFRNELGRLAPFRSQRRTGLSAGD